MTIKKEFIFFFLFLILAAGGTAKGDAALKVLETNSPEFAATRFYAWYMHALNQNIYPLDSKQDEIKQYVTERLILAISQMPKGPEGLDGDYFVDAQEWDPAWEENITIVHSAIHGNETALDLVLTGPQNPNHKLNVTLVNEKNFWKIDKVKTGE